MECPMKAHQILYQKSAKETGLNRMPKNGLEYQLKYGRATKILNAAQVQNTCEKKSIIIKLIILENNIISIPF
ncbi:MAG: hypothetical protein V1732_03495 [Patescibacteria group bacterium]